MMTICKNIFILFLLIQVNAYAEDFGLNFSYDNNNIDTLYGNVTLENIQNYPDQIYSAEITFTFDPNALSIDTIIFDNSIFDSWGGMIYSIDNDAGICILAGAGSTAIATPGEVMNLIFSVKDTNVFINPQDYIKLTRFMINEDIIYPINPTDILEQINNLPHGFTLKQNYPNPFNPSTTIEFSLNQASVVTLSIFNMLGQNVKNIQYERLTVGTYSYIWNGLNQAGNKVSSGTYFYRLKTSEEMITKKMILIK